MLLGGVHEIIQRIWETFHAALQAAHNMSSSAKSLIKREEMMKNESLSGFTAPAFRVPQCCKHMHAHTAPVLCVQ